MIISQVQEPSIADLGHAVADNYLAGSAGSSTRAAVVKDSDGGYRAYVVPSLPGQSASGSSPLAAESNLNLILDVRA
ncbi:MAG TPA: hypothetical protein VGD59_06330 [Acidisarcina sp.]